MEEKAKRGSTAALPYRSLFWPVALITLGVVMLLFQAGILTPQSIGALLQLWPLILVAIGIDIVFGRQSPNRGAIIGLGTAAVALALMFVGPAFGLGAAYAQQDDKVSAAVDGAEVYNVELDMNSGTINVGALPSESGDLIQGDLQYYGELIFEVQGETERDIRLDTRSIFPFLSTEPTEWDVQLNPDLDLDLLLDLNSGTVNADLSDHRLNALEIDLNSGDMTADLPQREATMDLIVDLNSGDVNVNIPDGATLDVPIIDVNSGTVILTLGENVAIDGEIDLNSGVVTLDVPDDAAVRLNVEDMNSGSVELPSDYTMVREGDDPEDGEGVWESPNAADAMRVIEFRMDINSGNVVVR